MMTNSNEKTENKRDNYVCEYCDFTCSYKSDYIRHCSTRKHKMMTMDDPNKNNGEPTHICSHCKKIYKTKQSLWVHKQKCKAPEKENISMVIQNAPQHNLRLCKVAIEGCRPYVPETPLSRATFMELMNNHNLPLIHQNLPNKESFY